MSEALPVFLRPKITPIIEDDGGVLLTVEWISTDPASNIAKDENGNVVVSYKEECRIKPNRLGCGYVSRVGLPQDEHATAGLPSMFIDPQGLRHIIHQVDPAVVPMLGASIGG